MANSKVKYGLRHVMFAVVTETVNQDGTTTSSYGNLTSWPGAVSISLAPQASKSVFRADDSDYYVSYGDGSIEGDFESAMVPEALKEALGWTARDDDDIAVESATNYRETKYVALLFEIDGDQTATRHCLYKCSMSRPAIASQTTGENGQKEPISETLTVTAIPRADEDRYIHAYADGTTKTTAYDDWYDAVPVPTFTP